MKNKVLITLLLAVVTVLLGVTAQAQGLNGTDVRPFYVIAHNPNTLADAEEALKCDQLGDPCANELEPDIIVLPAGATDLNQKDDPTGLVVYHDYVLLTSRVPLTLAQYLQGVHDLAKTHPNLALLFLDIKSSAATQAYGLEMINDVHNILNVDGVMLNVIYNVGGTDDKKVFDQMIPLLTDREAISVDGEDNANIIVSDLKGMFQSQNLPAGNIAYGDGTLGFGPNLSKAVDYAAFLRASTGYPNAINDVFTIELPTMMSWFMDAGTDGIIPDMPDPIHPEYTPWVTAQFLKLLQVEMGSHPELRLATRDDNPFHTKNEAYGLEVTTLNTATGGTDAPLTFTLEGCKGTSEVTVHTGQTPSGAGSLRMESGQTDHVTIPSLDLGKLTKLQVYNHGGAANAPDWDLGTVALSSVKYLGNDEAKNIEYRATWNKTIKDSDTVQIDLTPSFQEPAPTISCPSPITVNNATGYCGAAVDFNVTAQDMCSALTPSTSPAPSSFFNVGDTNVSSIATSNWGLGSASCSFKVTVNDVEKPMISCPGPQVVSATGPLGAIASFNPTATDNCSVASVTSTPASGSLFAIGDTTVNSVALDNHNNQSSCSFNVHVKGAAEQLNDLIAKINGMVIDPTNKNALIVKLQQALSKLSDQNGGPVCGPLKSFINLVSGISGKSISVADADYLIAQANQIRAVVGCQ